MTKKDFNECQYIDRMKVARKDGYIERMRSFRKLANDAEANYNDKRFKTKLIDSFPEF